jgi:hypothetical protein
MGEEAGSPLCIVGAGSRIRPRSRFAYMAFGIMPVSRSRSRLLTSSGKGWLASFSARSSCWRKERRRSGSDLVNKLGEALVRAAPSRSGRRGGGRREEPGC